jgi:hypothetical protein
MKNQKKVSIDNSLKAHCIFCGSTIGQISDRTEGNVTAVFYCQKCRSNYCDQCSYEKKINGKLRQYCLRCDSEIEKVQ